MPEINPRLFVFVFLFILLYIGMFQSWIFFAIGGLAFPHHPVIVLNNSSNSSNITYVYRTVTVLVTPTPDGHTYFAGEYQNGTRLLQRPFTFIRYDALGKQDMKVTTIVYDYMTFEKLHWFNPADYKYYEYTPTTPDSKFLLIFVTVFMDNIAGEDTRMWSFNRSAFAVYDGITTYRPIEYPYQLRFKELEYTKTFDKSTLVQAFKSMREYSSKAEYVKTAGEYNDEKYYLRGGSSNAIDGYLLFEIQKNDNPEQLMVLGQFYVFGSSQWRLKA